MISSEDLRFFNVLARSASLAEAARKMDVTPPAVTQRLQALEARIGIRLIDRSGRRMVLTDEGDLVASHGMIVADAMEALSEALANRKKAVSGHLRIAAPHGFGRLHVAPVVDAFAKAHPGVTVTLDLADHPGAHLVESSDVIVTSDHLVPKTRSSRRWHRTDESSAPAGTISPVLRRFSRLQTCCGIDAWW